MKLKSILGALALTTCLSAPAFAEAISVLVEGGGEQLQKAIAEKFTAETGIEVNFVVVPYSGVFERLSAEIASGSANYDVVTIDVIWMALFAEFAEPLDGLFTEAVTSNVAPALLADAKIGGSYIGMPAWANAEILFYRKDLFEDPAEQAAFKEKYGYDLAAPTTWQQFRDVSIFFTRDTDGDGTIDLYGTDVKGVNPEEWMATVLQAGSPGIVLDDAGAVIIDNAQHQTALDFYVSSHCADNATPPTGVAQIDWGASQNLFYQGKTAMMRFWAHAYRLTPEDSLVEGKVGVAPMIGGEAGVAAVPGPWYNIIPKTSTHKDAARQFVAFAIANNALGIEAPLGLAATNSAYESYMGKPGFEHFKPLLATLAAPATKGRPLTAKWQEIVDQAVTPMLQDALGCEADTGDLLAEAKAIIEDIL
jgi:ABC-type glycerol-3-phosphate transport system substrate-binding protein